MLNKTRNELSTDELWILDETVLPNAKEWMRRYPVGSSMFNHGLATVEYWNAQGDPDIAERYEEYVSRQNRPKDGQYSMDEWNNHIRVLSRTKSLHADEAEKREVFGHEKLPPISDSILPNRIRAKYKPRNFEA